MGTQAIGDYDRDNSGGSARSVHSAHQGNGRKCPLVGHRRSGSTSRVGPYRPREPQASTPRRGERARASDPARSRDWPGKHCGHERDTGREESRRRIRSDWHDEPGPAHSHSHESREAGDRQEALLLPAPTGLCPRRTIGDVRRDYPSHLRCRVGSAHEVSECRVGPWCQKRPEICRRGAEATAAARFTRRRPRRRPQPPRERCRADPRRVGRRVVDPRGAGSSHGATGRRHGG